MQITNPTQLYIKWKCLTNPDSSNYNSISIRFVKKIFLSWESLCSTRYPICNMHRYRFINYTVIGLNSLAVASLSRFHHQLISRFFKNE